MYDKYNQYYYYKLIIKIYKIYEYIIISIHYIYTYTHAYGTGN